MNATGSTDAPGPNPALMSALTTEHRRRGGSERVIPARVVASSDSVHERVRVVGEAGFNGQRGLAEAVQIRQGDTPALAEFTDVPNCYVVSQASARLDGEHCRVGTALPGQVITVLDSTCWITCSSRAEGSPRTAHAWTAHARAAFAPARQ